MGEIVAKASQPAEAKAAISLRLQNTLQVVREDEARFKRVIELRRLKRRVRKGFHAK